MAQQVVADDRIVERLLSLLIQALKAGLFFTYVLLEEFTNLSLTQQNLPVGLLLNATT